MLTGSPESADFDPVRWAEAHQNFVIVSAGANPASAVPLAAALLPARLESPQPGSFESGIGLIRGWVCDADTVEVQINDGLRQRVAYGTKRSDTVAVCGDADNGFGYTVNWNNLGNGRQRLRAFADGLQFADVAFTVTTLGMNYLRGVSGEYTLPNFPQAGKTTTVRWAEPHQNFVIVGYR
jgi:hypothetical protein